MAPQGRPLMLFAGTYERFLFGLKLPQGAQVRPGVPCTARTRKGRAAALSVLLLATR